MNTVFEKENVLLQILDSNNTLSGARFKLPEEVQRNIVERSNTTGIAGSIKMPKQLENETVDEYFKRASGETPLNDITHFVKNIRVHHANNKSGIVGDVEFLDKAAFDMIESGTHMFGIRSACLQHTWNGKNVNEIVRVASFNIVETPATWHKNNPGHPLADNLPVVAENMSWFDS